MNIKFLNIIGTTLTIISAIVSIASGKIGDKILDNKIKEEVAKALTQQNG